MRDCDRFGHFAHLVLPLDRATSIDHHAACQALIFAEWPFASPSVFDRVFDPAGHVDRF